MQSLYTRTKSYLSATSTPNPLHFRTEKSATALFPATNPAIDGEDCLHDCASCTETLPRKWEIDEEDKLYGHVNGWATHLIVGTGKSDWVRDVTDEKGSIMEAVGKLGVELGNGKVMLSASDMPEEEDGSRCILLPQWKVVEGVTQETTGWVLETLSKGSTNSTPLQSAVKDGEEQVQNGDVSQAQNGQAMQHRSLPESIPEGIRMSPLSHRAIILMCSHGTRDWRCGKSAPLLKRELERHLRPLGLQRDFGDTRPGGVGIYFINHVGGHKYSANVMVYRRCGSGQQLGESKDEAVQGIWLARVRPEDCENIVKYTILQGKLVKPQRQLRGGFDRERGVLSW